VLKADDFLLRELVAKGVVRPADIERARGEAAARDISLIEALQSLSLASSRDIALVRALVCETPFIELNHFDLDLSHAALLDRSVAELHQVFPLFVMESGVIVAAADPLNYRGLELVRQRLGREIDVALCEPKALRRLIERAYRQGHAVADNAADSADTGPAIEVDPVVATVNDILVQAIESRASDIHINPDEDTVHLRYRVDGVLLQRPAPSASLHDAIVRRLKVLARLDLTQTRKPQDGKFTFAVAGQDFDLRLSIVPTIWGENVVMRILRHAREIQSFDALDMPADVRAPFESALARPYGMILVTGPTGSGKTTTLYTALASLNTPERNIVTIEDPVEIRLPMIRQTQVQHEIGLTFAIALRSMLRQDPDVALVGEIRDKETAQIATQAALTGHLVLSTLHTNDAPGAVSRLRDFDVPPFVIASGLLGVIAQRLVRRLCDVCRVPAQTTDAELGALGLTHDDRDGLMVPGSCPRCGRTGFRGRLGVYEYLAVTPSIRGLIAGDATPMTIAEAAMQEGMRSLWNDALAKARIGQTTLAEVARVRADDARPPARRLEMAA
jgi:type II secretory ATPase GspE/PulE/Tfp pilus assembly ATPase PilB-like protein